VGAVKIKPRGRGGAASFPRMARGTADVLHDLELETSSTVPAWLPQSLRNRDQRVLGTQSRPTVTERILPNMKSGPSPGDPL